MNTVTVTQLYPVSDGLPGTVWCAYTDQDGHPRVVDATYLGSDGVNYTFAAVLENAAAVGDLNYTFNPDGEDGTVTLAATTQPAPPSGPTGLWPN